MVTFLVEFEGGAYSRLLSFLKRSPAPATLSREVMAPQVLGTSEGTVQERVGEGKFYLVRGTREKTLATTEEEKKRAVMSAAAHSRTGCATVLMNYHADGSTGSASGRPGHCMSLRERSNATQSQRMTRFG